MGNERHWQRFVFYECFLVQTCEEAAVSVADTYTCSTKLKPTVELVDDVSCELTSETYASDDCTSPLVHSPSATTNHYHQNYAHY